MHKKFRVIFASLTLLSFNISVFTDNVFPSYNLVVQAKPKKSTTKSALLKLTYSGDKSVDVNDGNPDFSSEDLSVANGHWDSYNNLDSLNRPTVANALINKASMPTTKREPLTFTPTGWHNKKLKSGYLYNRSHLIGYQLTGQNNNPKNLITGTRNLNNPEMLHYEDDIADYIKQNPTDYVRYQVTPIFEGNELVARGVHMQAQSVGNDSIHFNVYIFNVEDGVHINYNDGTSTVSSSQTSTPASTSLPYVTSAAQIADNNEQIVYYTPNGSRYHFDRNCRALRRSSDIEQTTVSNAQSMGLTLCGFED